MGTPLLAHCNCACEIASNHQSAVAAASNPSGVLVTSATGFSGGYPRDSSRSSAFSYSAGNHSVINECSNNNYAPFNENHSFAQRLPAAGIANRYLADSLGYPDAPRFDTNALSSAQPHVFSTGALNLTNPTYAGYSGVPPTTRYSSGPSNYIERPFAADAAFNGTNTFASGSTTYTNGQAIANNLVPMPVSNNPILPLDMGLMTGNPFALPPDMHTTGRASANYPFSMQDSNNSIAPMDMGLMAEGPFALPPNMYTTSQASANNPLPMPTSNNALIPVDIGPPNPQRAPCKKCNQTFKRQSDLVRHAKKHQSGPKNWKCVTRGCNYASYRKDKLVDHMRRRHAAGGSRLN